jgi:hypothetical protein
MRLDFGEGALEAMFRALRLAEDRGTTHELQDALVRGIKVAAGGKQDSTVRVLIDSPTSEDPKDPRASFLLIGEYLTLGLIDFGAKEGWSLHS